MTPSLQVFSPAGLGEVNEGDDLAAAAVALFDDLRTGDVVVVTSKVVSKAEGRVRTGGRDAAIVEETRRVVARRGATTIVRNRLGLTMAAAGIDASNVAVGSIVLLPQDPDASARALRRRLHELTGHRVGVVITDTSGRAWRHGQTDIAIGAAGLRVAEDFNGRTDSYGNPLAVTLTAVADELAAAAELSQGKLTARPIAVIRGRSDLVLDLEDDGPGAATLIREEGSDLFGYGAREAVLRALAGRAEDRAPFGAAVPAEELASAFGSALGHHRVSVHAIDDTHWRLDVDADTAWETVAAVLFAHGWEALDSAADRAAPQPRNGPEQETRQTHCGITARIRPVTP